MKQINQKIRTFIPEDFSQVNELWSQTGMGGAHRGDNLEIIQQTIESGGKLLVMEEISTQKIIGTSWLTNDKRRIYLHHFGILPEYQDKGLSKPLMIESMKFAKETGLQVKLEVHRDNSRAINLYEKMGFKYLGDYDVYIVRDIEKNVSSPHGAMLTLLLFLFITINSLSFAQEIPFIKNDWQKAVDEAKKRNKYLINVDSISIPISKISSVELDSSLWGTDIIIKSVGAGEIIGKKFTKSDAKEIRRLIQEKQNR